MKCYTLVLFSLVFLSGFAKPAEVLFIAGEPSHGWNAHEFPKGCDLLAKALNESGLGISASVSYGWPESGDAFEEIDAVVIFCDGGEYHLANDRVDILNTLYDRQGMGFAFLHYAVEPGNEELAEFLLKSIGGYFEVDWSVNPIWHLRDAEKNYHPVANGTSLDIEDEWYYHMRFREDGGYFPVLSALPPASSLGNDGPRSGNPTIRSKLENGEAQHLAWVRVGHEGQGQRGFGFTGGNFHYNWNDPDFRKLVLNGIAWTAGVEVPEQGIESTPPNIVKHRSIDIAIALGDHEDIRQHLANNPNLLNTPGRGAMTPLHQAVMRRKPDVARLLLEFGSDPNIQTKSQQTALHLAILRDSLEMAELLIENGVDFTVRDKQGWTVLHHAGAKNQLEIAKLCVEAGADPNMLSAAGGTPLHEAAASGGKEIIEYFLEVGVDPTVVSSHGVTALDIAKEYKNDAAIAVLQ